MTTVSSVLPVTAAVYFREGDDTAVFSDPTLLTLLRERSVTPASTPLTLFQPPPPWATVRCLPQMVAGKEGSTGTSGGGIIQPLASLPIEGVEVSMSEVATVAAASANQHITHSSTNAGAPLVPSPLCHRRYRVYPLGPICGVTDAATIQPCEDISLPAAPSCSEPSYVVVDGPCAEAVLRGSNIYTPGVWCLVDSQRRTAGGGGGDAGLWPGAPVVILAPKHGVSVPLKGSVLKRQVSSSSEVADGGVNPNKTMFRAEDYVAVGRGVWTVTWRDLISKQQDLNQGKKRVRDANTTTATPSTDTVDAAASTPADAAVPPLQGDAAAYADLAARNIAIVTTDTYSRSETIGSTTTPPPPASEWYSTIGELAIKKHRAAVSGSTTAVGVVPASTLPLQPLVFMAQNISSMLPAVLLAAGIHSSKYTTSNPASLLDACAAPGGKTSHLLGQLFSCDHQDGPNWFKLQACDRSSSRAKSMQKLLQVQFPPELLKDTLKVHCGKDVGSLLKETNNDSTTTTATPSVLFDGIILDPPCTCLGLRPRLSPHTHGAVAIKASADYQRLLLTRCLSQLKPGGRLVYSTCTISAEENEDTLLWILDQMKQKEHTGPKAHLVQAKSENELLFSRSALGTLAREQVLGRVAICGDEEDTRAPLMVFRFMPNPTPSEDVGMQLADGVGFFVAVFERSL